ncbi:MAG: NupC/NupG family nucleoside CNT transporter [Bacteroidetes bacterium]|nr:NupC/NupG family nucleoside CNT transporter [Bacteroidota bacterium]
MSILRGLIGIAALLAFAYLLSSDRKRINWRLVGIGMSLQLVLALLVLKVPFVKSIFDLISKGFVSVLNFTKDGSAFLFGDLINVDANGFIFAFQILPTIVFFAALSSALYYLGIIQWIVFAFAWLMSKTMHLSGAESLAAAGNIFLGQTESPLLVRPYLEKMTKSEIMCLMTGGMATIAGGVLGAYVGYLGGDSLQEQQIFASHLLAASIMSAPAAIVAAKMLVPESHPEMIDRELNISKEKIGSNILDAISTGTRDGLKLAVNVGVMLLVFTAFMYMFNAFSFQIGTWLGLNDNIIAFTEGRFDGLSLQFVLGMLFSPVAWLLGVDWQDAVLVGQLLGEKTILNEFFAYASLGKLKAAEMFLNHKSIIIATYALCGFANFASIGIQIGGIGALASNQQSTLAKLGIKALIGGTIACFLTATIAGMLF